MKKFLAILTLLCSFAFAESDYARTSYVEDDSYLFCDIYLKGDLHFLENYSYYEGVDRVSARLTAEPRGNDIFSADGKKLEKVHFTVNLKNDEAANTVCAVIVEEAVFEGKSSDGEIVSTIKEVKTKSTLTHPWINTSVQPKFLFFKNGSSKSGYISFEDAK